MDTRASTPSPWLLRIWDRIPLPIRALVSGMLVFMTLQFGWGVLVVLNLETTPAIPWHAPAGLLYLWIVFRYFGGRWAPVSTTARRRKALGARSLSSSQWPMALAACGATAVFIIAVAMLNYRLIAVPEDATDLSMYPWWTTYSLLIMVAVVAGVSEEAGFRGYLQGALERRYGAPIAIGATSLAFWLVHLNHPSGMARWPSLLTMGIALGALAYTSRSIYPALLTHALADSLVFVGAQSEIGPPWLWSPPLFADSGLDAPLTGTVLIATMAGLAAIMAMSRLRKATG
jgi:membrane protease YdiL (CAAX protease family)